MNKAQESIVKHDLPKFLIIGLIFIDEFKVLIESLYRHFAFSTSLYIIYLYLIVCRYNFYSIFSIENIFFSNEVYYYQVLHYILYT